MKTVKTERVYMLPNKNILKVPGNTLGGTVPCLLFLTSEIVFKDERQYEINYSIRGRFNPLPFSECTIPRYAMRISIEEWLEQNGWVEIGRNYS